MGVPLAGDFDLAVPSAIDSRMVWTGTYDESSTNLNNISNRYRGLITYVTGDQNLYVCQNASNFQSIYSSWEKIVTSSVDSPSIITSDVLTLGLVNNGQLLRIDSPNLVNVYLPSSSPSLQAGFNVTIVQMNAGAIQFNNNQPGSNQVFSLRNRLNFTRTAGRYAVASLLRLGNTADVLLYGDLI